MTFPTSDPAPEDGDGAVISRRAPFSDNPAVGARGLRTQQRIVDAALAAFGEHGYEATTIDRIATVAGCSRVSVYQYFEDKQHIFRSLTGEVSKQLWASIDALEPILGDQRGWDALRSWMSRHSDVHARYQPIYRAFGNAAGSDPTLAGASARVHTRHIVLFESKVVSATALPDHQLQPTVRLLFTALSRSLDMASVLRTARPDSLARARVDDALTDVFHRALFGVVPGVNLRPDDAPPMPALEIGAGLRTLFDQVATLETDAADPNRRALTALLAVGEDVITKRGYLGTRVEDVIDAAQVSRGAFYRYFDNVQDFVGVIAARAMRALSTALGDLPDLPASGERGKREALLTWLDRFGDASARHGAMVSIWVEGARADHLRADTAAALDWGRRRMAEVIGPRPFGDVEVEALVLLGLVEALTSRARSSTELEVALDVIETTFLFDRGAAAI